MSLEKGLSGKRFISEQNYLYSVLVSPVFLRKLWLRYIFLSVYPSDHLQTKTCGHLSPTMSTIHYFTQFFLSDSDHVYELINKDTSCSTRDLLL